MTLYCDLLQISRAATRILALINEAKAFDAESPLDATPGDCGIMTQYSMDVIVAGFLRKAQGDFPEPGKVEDTGLSPIFATADLLLYLCLGQPAFLRRFTAAVYRFAPVLSSNTSLTPPALTPGALSKIIAMYVAMLRATTDASNPANNRNTFGMKRLWTILARIVNRSPPTAACAQALVVILVLCGYDMNVRYGLQFRKVCDVIFQRVLPQLQAVSGTLFQQLSLLMQDPGASRTFVATDMPILRAPPNGSMLPERETTSDA
jgi:hypothetical protein